VERKSHGNVCKEKPPCQNEDEVLFQKQMLKIYNTY
jgi:hypothetical protein